jgi:hypothetical protein
MISLTKITCIMPMSERAPAPWESLSFADRSTVAAGLLLLADEAILATPALIWIT